MPIYFVQINAIYKIKISPLKFKLNDYYNVSGYILLFESNCIINEKIIAKI